MKKNIAGPIPDKSNTHNSGRVNPADEQTLDDLIDGCREQDIHSQERLYKQFYGYAMSVALTYGQSKADAVEVVNDSFMKVFKNIHTFKTSEPFKPWFRKIVVHTAIDRARANKKFQKEVQVEDFLPQAPVDIEAELNARQIYKLLDELPDLLRFVFNMYEIEGYSHREISDQLDIAESSSRTYLTRAKARLRELYQSTFMDEQ